MGFDYTINNELLSAMYVFQEAVSDGFVIYYYPFLIVLILSVVVDCCVSAYASCIAGKSCHVSVNPLFFLLGQLSLPSLRGR